MVLEQKIEIKINNNDEEIGSLVISSKIKKETEDLFFNVEPKNVKGMLLEHIKKDQNLDNTTPIQYCPFTIHSTDIFLLEETEYNLSFILNNKLFEPEELIVFNHLKKQSHGRSDLIFNHWNDVWFANINFRGFAGKTFIDIIYKGSKLIDLMVEVRTKKLNYDVEYAEMIADFAKYSSGLLFNINSSLYQNHIPSEKSQSTLYEYFMLLEYLFRPQNLPSVVEYLSRQLYSLLDTTSEIVPTTFVSNFGSREIAELSSNPHQFCETDELYSIYSDDGKYYAPLMIKQMIYKDNIDVPENRFYKFFLEFIRDLINDLYGKVGEGYVKLSLGYFRENINQFLSHRYFNDISRLEYVPLNSQVLQKKEGYREILEYYLIFEFGLKISLDDLTDRFRGFEKELGKIYEIWCYFKFIDILNDLTDSTYDFNDFIDLNSWSLTLNKINKLDYFNPLIIDNKEVKITLMYNYEFSRPKMDNENYIYASYSLPLDPDYTLVIEYENHKKLLHFDAKYRVDSDNGFKKEDIHKMHTYKDSISDSILAYIFYPGNKSKIFNEIDGSFGSVGAFTLKPGETKNDEKEIVEFIRTVIEEWLNRLSDS